MTHDERRERVAEAIEANSDLASNGYSQDFIRNLASDAIAASDATLEFTERVQNAVAMELNEWGIAKHKAPLVANFILNRIKTAMQCDAK